MGSGGCNTDPKDGTLRPQLRFAVLGQYQIGPFPYLKMSFPSEPHRGPYDVAAEYKKGQAWAEAVETVYRAQSDAERQTLLRRLAATAASPAAGWAMAVLGEAKPKETTEFLQPLVDNDKLSLENQVSLDRVLCRIDRPGWRASDRRRRLLERWLNAGAGELPAVRGGLRALAGRAAFRGPRLRPVLSGSQPGPGPGRPTVGGGSVVAEPDLARAFASQGRGPEGGVRLVGAVHSPSQVGAIQRPGQFVVASHPRRRRTASPSASQTCRIGDCPRLARRPPTPGCKRNLTWSWTPVSSFREKSAIERSPARKRPARKRCTDESQGPSPVMTAGFLLPHPSTHGQAGAHPG